MRQRTLDGRDALPGPEWYSEANPSAEAVRGRRGVAGTPISILSLVVVVNMANLVEVERKR